MRRGGIANLSKPAADLHRILRRHLVNIASPRWWETSQRPEPLSVSNFDIRKLAHGYFVSCHKSELNTPCWYHASLTWVGHTVVSREGILVDDSIEPSKSAGFYVSIHNRFSDIRGGLFYMTGHQRSATGEHENAFVATFVSTSFDNSVLVGTWSGRDHFGLPTTAPMILSKSGLSLEQLFKLRVYPNNHILLNGKSIYETPSLPS